MRHAVLAAVLLLSGSVLGLSLKEDTAATVLVGPLVDWADGKTILSDNDDFDPNDIVCRLIKGSSESTLTLTKTGGNNNINLTGYGMATLTLTASNVDTAGQLQLQFCDAVSGGYLTETILPFCEVFTVYPANVYDSLFTDNTAISKVSAFSPVIAAGYVGDYKTGETVYFIWRTNAVPSAAGTVYVYKNNGTSEAEIPTGVMDTRNFDSKTNVHLCTINLSANSFYERGKDYAVVLSGATIDGQTVYTTIATFSIENRTMLPTFLRDG